MRKRISHNIKGLSKSTEIIALLQFSKKDAAFRNKFGIPKAGFKSEITKANIYKRSLWFKKKDIWWNNLTSDPNKYSQYEQELKEIQEWLDCSKDEINMVEDYLIYGTPIIALSDFSRIKMQIDPKTNNQQIWLRVDGLSLDQIGEEIEKVKHLEPKAIKVNRKEPTRDWRENIILHKQIFDLYLKGLEEKDILKLLIEKQKKYFPKSSLNKSITLGNIRKIISRLKKNLSKPS